MAAHRPEPQVSEPGTPPKSVSQSVMGPGQELGAVCVGGVGVKGRAPVIHERPCTMAPTRTLAPPHQPWIWIRARTILDLDLDPDPPWIWIRILTHPGPYLGPPSLPSGVQPLHEQLSVLRNAVNTHHHLPVHCGAAHHLGQLLV